MPAASLVTAAGIAYIVQCSSGPPRKFTSASCMTTANDLVPYGPLPQSRPGKTLAPQRVFAIGISAPSANAGEVTFRVLPLLAGNTASASPTGAGGAVGACGVVAGSASAADAATSDTAIAALRRTESGRGEALSDIVAPH